MLHKDRVKERINNIIAEMYPNLIEVREWLNAKFVENFLKVMMHIQNIIKECIKRNIYK